MKKLLFLSICCFGLAVPAFAQVPVPLPVMDPIVRYFEKKQVKHQGVMSGEHILNKVQQGVSVKQVSKIQGFVSQVKNLHAVWYESMKLVSGGVRSYRKVSEIFEQQQQMLSMMSRGLSDLRDGGFTPQQIKQASNTYMAMLEQNITNISQLQLLLTPNKANLTDPQRLKFIDNIADQMTKQQALMGYFTAQCGAMTAQYRQEQRDLQQLQALLGVSK